MATINRLCVVVIRYIVVFRIWRGTFWAQRRTFWTQRSFTRLQVLQYAEWT